MLNVLFIKRWNGILFIILCLCLHSVRAQTQFDSLHQNLSTAVGAEEQWSANYELGKFYSLGKLVIDSADYYLRQAVDIAQRAKLQNELGDAYWRLGRLHTDTDMPNNQLLPLLDSALLINEQNSNLKNVMELLNMKGLIYQHMGLQEKALRYFNECLTIAKQLRDSHQMVALYNSMAGSFDENQDTAKVLEYYRSGLEIADTIGWTLGKSVLMNNIADVYLIQDKYEEAEAFFNESIQLKRSINNTTNLSVGLCQVAYVYMETGRWELAVSSAQEGLKMAQESNYTNGITICLNTLSEWAGSREKYTDQIAYAHEGIAVLDAKGSDLNDLKQGFYESIYKAYQSLNRYDSAFHYLTKYQWIADTLQQIQKAEELANQEIDFKLQEAEYRNQLLKEEQEKSEFLLQRRQNIIILFALLVLFILGGAIWWNRKKAKLNRKLDRLVKEKTEALQESVRNLEVANEELTYFTYITSHDLREPLRNISGFTSLLSRRLQSPHDDIPDLLKNIKQSTKQMDKLIQDVMQYSLINKKELTVEKVAVGDLVKATIEDLKLMLLKKNGHIIYAEDLLLNTSKVALQLIINNLCKNAIHYNTSLAPKVTIYSEEREGELLLHFEDNGIGIAPEFQDQVFMMFKRLHSRAHYEGSGLGLAITKRMTEQIGGTISLSSTEGEGSTFTVHLPASVIVKPTVKIAKTA